MSALRDKYFHTLGFDPSDKTKLRRALFRAYQLRTFEIEHYWKRATYFWGFQVAIFAAFSLLLQIKNGEPHPGALILLLSGLGVLISFANLLSAKGSKFWQNNWERHIDMLEDDVEGRLHKVVWLPEGKVSFSVSRVNQNLSLFMIGFWTLVAIYVALKYLGVTALNLGIFHDVPRWGKLIMMGAPIVVGLVLLFRQITQLIGTLPKDDGDHTVPIKLCTRWHRQVRKGQVFIRRYAPDGSNED